MVITEELRLQSGPEMQIHEITGEVQQKVSGSGISAGTVTVFIPGATGALTTVEYEPGLVADLHELFGRIIPLEKTYQHNERWHDGNGHSHVRASLLGPSLVVPFSSGELILGTWQQIIFIDFDVPARSRRLVLQIMGE